MESCPNIIVCMILEPEFHNGTLPAPSELYICRYLLEVALTGAGCRS